MNQYPYQEDFEWNGHDYSEDVFWSAYKGKLKFATYKKVGSRIEALTGLLMTTQEHLMFNQQLITEAAKWASI